MAKLCLCSCFKDTLCVNDNQDWQADKRASSWVQCSSSHASVALQGPLTKHTFEMLTKHTCMVLSCMTSTEEDEGFYKFLPANTAYYLCQSN